MKYRLILLVSLFATLIALQYVNNRQEKTKPVPEPLVAVSISSLSRTVEPRLFLQKHEDVTDLTIYNAYKDYLKTVDKELRDSFYFELDTEDKVVVLSFDDGPLAYTREIMAVLEEKNAPATFFLLCSRIDETNSLWYDNPLFSIGLHSFSHKDYRDLSSEETNADFNSCIETFESFGLEKVYFRPPYGVITKAMVKNLEQYKLKGILWSLDSGDWDGKNGTVLVSNVLDNLQPGDIILFHDGVDLADLSAIIEGIHDLDFQIITMDELLQYPKVILDY